MSKRIQPERAVKKDKAESKPSKKGKKGSKKVKSGKDNAPVKKVKVENSVLDQLKTVSK